MSAEAAADTALATYAELETEDARREFLDNHPALICAQSVERLADEARSYLRTDTARSLRISEAALTIATRLGAPEPLARALRAKGNACWFLSDCRTAVELLDRAILLFDEAGRADELGRTLSTSIQPLILLGEYDRALLHTERARVLFTAQNDQLRLARLSINEANIHHRQERYRDALNRYEQALHELLPFRDSEGIGVALHNMAVCLISLDEFERALEVHQRARQFLEANSMPRLAFQADYNIAYLYYLRGDHERALELLRATRAQCSTDDPYHAALCDLDSSDIYLELNLAAEAEETAQRAADQFTQLGMGYETARSLTNLALAAAQQRQPRRALEIFADAKKMFTGEAHRAGESFVSLCQALLHAETGDFAEARSLCATAEEFFRQSDVRRKAVLCDLLMARLDLQDGALKAAAERCRAALERLEPLNAPVLSCQAHLLEGKIHEACADPLQAAEAYRGAGRALEMVRGALQGEELRIAFVSNRLEMYERLAKLALDRGLTGAAAEEAFLYIQRAKSRSLMDIMLGRARPLAARHFEDAEADQRVRELRAQINSYYHRIQSEELRQEGLSPGRIEELWNRARASENELLRVLEESREVPPEALIPDVGPVSIAAIGAALGPGAELVEYFEIEGQIVAGVLGSEAPRMVRVGESRRLKNEWRMLQLQFSKVRYGRVKPDDPAVCEAALSHLQQLYRLLIAPLEPYLAGTQLIMAPHGFLHYLPMHALHDGKRYLADRFLVSYTPSAAVYALGDSSRPEPRGGSLVLGVHDPDTPWILDEAHAVADAVQEPRLFLGEQATLGRLRKWGPQSRLIHIATHAYFRRDNPMFSAVRLGDSWVNVYDLYSMHLPADLLALSGCGTGLAAIAAGDELLGLARGLLYAGARSLLLTLWDAHDRSTAEAMRVFYSALRQFPNKAMGLRTAMAAIRELHPHPYYWAPYLLVGKAQ